MNRENAVKSRQKLGSVALKVLMISARNLQQSLLYAFPSGPGLVGALTDAYGLEELFCCNLSHIYLTRYENGPNLTFGPTSDHVGGHEKEERGVTGLPGKLLVWRRRRNFFLLLEAWLKMNYKGSLKKTFGWI